MPDKQETPSNVGRSNRCVSPFPCPLRLLYPDLLLFFVPVLSTADVPEPRVSDDNPTPFDVLVPVFVVVVEFDNSGRPRFVSLPSIGYYASSSSSVEVVG